MRIGIDLRCLLEEKQTGVGEYTIAVIKKILEDNKKDDFIFFLNYYRKIKNDFAWIEQRSNAEIKEFHFPNKILNLFFWLFSWPKVDKLIGGVDVFFMPNFSFIALSNDCHKILTIHDLSFELFPESFSLKRRLWHFMVNPRQLCRQSNKIFTVSKSTKQDLISIYNIDPEKIKINYPPFDSEKFSRVIDVEERQAVVKKYKLPINFILCLGTIEPRKNVVALIRAFDEFKERNNSGLKLVIVGGRGWVWKNVFNQVEKSKFKNEIIFTNFIAEKEKVIFYRLAKILIFASLFEGFGFPPLEAMASGLPVIASNCSSMPEILDGAVILINPYRPGEIALAIAQLYKSENTYKYYSEMGVRRAREITSLERKFEVTNNK